MKPEELERLDNRDGNWTLKAREWRATHSQVGRAMRWTMKLVKRKLENDNTIIVEFKLIMAMILREYERIENLRFKPATMVSEPVATIDRFFFHM